MAYIANTPDDVRVMLGAIGLDSLDQLFDMIPPEYRLDRPLAIPEALGELELTAAGRRPARPERRGRRPPLLPRRRELRPLHPGRGRRPRRPRRVLHRLHALPGRGEPGDAAGDLRVPDADRQLTGMDVSNASLYDGGSAVAEAVLMALTVTRRLGRVVVAGSVHPEYRQILATYLANLEPELVDRPRPRRPGRPRRPRRGDHRRHGGRRRPAPELLRAARGRRGARRGRPRARGRWRSSASTRSAWACSSGPGDYGADIVVAEGQWLGNPMALRRPVPRASWPAARSSSARCPAGSSARRPTATASAAGC